MVVALDPTTYPKVRPGIPKQVLPLPPATFWQVTPDGRRFLVAMPPAEPARVPINVLLNWMPGQRK